MVAKVHNIKAIGECHELILRLVADDTHLLWHGHAAQILDEVSVNAYAVGEEEIVDIQRSRCGEELWRGPQTV